MVLSLTNQSLKNKKKTPFLEGVFFCIFFSNEKLQESMSKIDLQYNKKKYNKFV